MSDTAAQAAIGAAARELKLPTVRAEAARLAGIAARERHTHLAYLADFSSDAVPTITPAHLAQLATGIAIEMATYVVEKGKPLLTVAG